MLASSHCDMTTGYRLEALPSMGMRSGHSATLRICMAPDTVGRIRLAKLRHRIFSTETHMVAAALDDGLLKPNRIAKVTLDFWFVTLLVGTIGGTVADDLSFRLGFGISTAAWIMGTLLVMV